MAITASRSFLSLLFLILVISNEVFCRGHIESDEDELAQFAIAEVNKLAHTNYIMVNLTKSSFKKVSRDVFVYHLSISAKIGGASGIDTYLAKIGFERKSGHKNKIMLVSFKSIGGRIIYEMPTSDHTAEANTSSHINRRNTNQRLMTPDQSAELLDRLRHVTLKKLTMGGSTSRNMNK